MNHYQQSLSIKAKPSDVYAALTTSTGIDGWWTQDCEVAEAEGGIIKLRFGGTYKELRIEKLDADREVHWLCTKAHIDLDQLERKDEWVGTQIVFRLKPQGKDATHLDFEHVGLVPNFECYDLCISGWNYFLKSLQEFAETGVGTPYERGDNCDHSSEHQE